MNEQDKLLELIREQLNNSADHMDAATQSRLTQIRSQALDRAGKPKWSWQLPTVALGSTAAVVALTISVMWAPATIQQGALEDLSLLSANDTFEFIEDVDFYEWLSEEQQNG